MAVILAASDSTQKAAQKAAQNAPQKALSGFRLGGTRFMVYMKDLHRQTLAVLSGGPVVLFTALTALERELYSFDMNRKVS